MNQTTFIADGKTKNFYFSFPFFLKSDVIIQVDSQPAVNCAMIPVKNGLNADIPFSGGQVHFTRPPKRASVITIKRKLPIKRIVDYQLTTPYSPTTHNQDMNYMVEILKDMQSGVDFLVEQPSESTNKAAIDTILQQIAQILAAIDAINARIDQIDIPDDFGDLTAIHTTVNNLSSTVSALNAEISGHSSMINSLTAFKNEVADYVIESQNPTAANNYTWYRKYKSGCVEQGGQGITNSGEPTPITLPIAMLSAEYKPLTQGRTATDGYTGAQWHIMPVSTTKSKQTAAKFYAQGSINGYNLSFGWIVHGMAAE